MRLYQRLLSALLSAALVCLLVLGAFSTLSVQGAAANALPDTMPAVETLFSANCAACHANGGNLIRRGKTLKQKALSRYGYDRAEAIETLVKQGKGAMPSYVDRLSETEIEAIAQYVLQQAQTGW